MPSYQTQYFNGGPRDCGTFFLDVIGQFSPENLIIRWTDQRRPTTPEVDAIIEKTWIEETARAQQTGQKLFDGPLARLAESFAEESRLTLTLGPVGYKEFLGTNLTHANLRYTHGPETLSDALGVSAAVSTRDGFILMGRRSQKVAYHAGRIHPVGGMVEPAKSPTQLPDPFHTIVKELTEETGLNPKLATECVCLGIVRDKHIVQPELIFDIAVSTEADVLCRSARQAEDRDEHTELVPIRNHPAATVSYMEQHFSELTPVGLATLLLHGLRHWGSGWFAAARGYLRSVI